MNNQIGYSLLLLTEVIPEQSITRNVPCIHARKRMVHQEMNVEFRNTCRLCERAIALAQVVAPLGENISLFLVLNEMSRFAVGWKHPGFRLLGKQDPSPPDCADDAAGHRSRKWDVECLHLSTLGFWDVN